jgi:hypothetical protein
MRSGWLLMTSQIIGSRMNIHEWRETDLSFFSGKDSCFKYKSVKRGLTIISFSTAQDGLSHFTDSCDTVAFSKHRVLLSGL